MPEIECPACGNATTLAVIGRTADEFCPTPDCDFPLFWAPSVLARPTEGLTLDTSLRRLPGTAGRVDIATIECPECAEPNPVANVLCLRCTTLLRPVPEPEVFLLPPPEFVEVVATSRAPVWPWILVGVLALALLVWWGYQAWG